MKIVMIGAGYVGLVSGTCFAESGNYVTCVDVDARKINDLRCGVIPIYEPGLSELILQNVESQRLHFTTNAASCVPAADLVFLAVGTPQSETGAANLGGLWRAVDSLAPHLSPDTVVVVKSTVPVGTNREVAERLQRLTGRRVHVASNPEFLKEGAAIDDFTKPDRVVVGVERPEVAETLHSLYRPFLRTEHPFLVMGWESAEMTKYVANCLLATKISFINEMANVCEQVGADIDDVRRGMGHDQRIGFAFLFPGVGYGGSCFPKDVRALSAVAHAHGVTTQILTAVDDVNNRQKDVLFSKLQHHFQGNLKDRTIALWGLAFKPRTDDIREAPSLRLIDALLEAGAAVQVHDPVALDNVSAIYGDELTYCQDQYTALDNADALAILTEWNEYRGPDFSEMKLRLRRPVIFDGRNLYDLHDMRQAGFTYLGIGRATETPAAVSDPTTAARRAA